LARLNGEHGLGGIFPAMVNTVLMFDVLGVARDAPEALAAGRADTPAVERGIDWLLERQRTANGLWDEPHHTATGFERVFYLRYHGYAHYFPLWALARYRKLRARGSRRVAFGM
jgi:hypothetical protein